MAASYESWQRGAWRRTGFVIDVEVEERAWWRKLRRFQQIFFCSGYVRE